jgi:hypothetical protein
MLGALTVTLRLAEGSSTWSAPAPRWTRRAASQSPEFSGLTTKSSGKVQRETVAEIRRTRIVAQDDIDRAVRIGVRRLDLPGFFVPNGICYNRSHPASPWITSDCKSRAHGLFCALQRQMTRCGAGCEGRVVMSKPKLALLVGAMIMLGLPAVPASAADLQVPPVAKADREAAACGPCGCLHVTWNRHRVLESTYGLAFDPRNFDQTEPYYYYGPVRSYPTFWCEVGSTQ